MKFNEMKYVRPDLDKEIGYLNSLLEKMDKTEDKEEFFSLLEEFYKKQRDLETASILVSIRHTIDTNDEFYIKENDFFDENGPLLQELGSKLSTLRLNSKFKKDIEERFGSYILKKDELRQMVFNKDIIEDLKEENRLSSEYEKLLSSSMINFEGEERTIAMIAPYAQDKDRAMRKKANDAIWGWFSENSEKFDAIYDSLVKVRDKMAKKLGFENYVPVAYAKLGRTDWTAKDAKIYRKQIKDSVVPLAQKYYVEQMERIGVKDPKNYDYSLMFMSGNPLPKGTEKELVDSASKMYASLSKETDEFFKVMTSCELMDLTAKKGKMAGGYCTMLPSYKVPYIFSNFNGTSGDVDVLTHEAGHAFQGYCSKDIYPDEYTNTTYESAEIHSMSMEFFTHPWMESFFKEDTEKYYYGHVLSAINFLPYGASIDEFQEWVYENPNATPKERNAKYREIEKEYLPHINYDGLEYLENGARWQRQLHVFTDPFYYLDYTLAQVCAFQFFIRDLKNHDDAWNDYVKLCKMGGTKPFTGLIEAVNIKNPFIDGTIKSVTTELEKYLETLDKSKIK